MLVLCATLTLILRHSRQAISSRSRKLAPGPYGRLYFKTPDLHTHVHPSAAVDPHSLLLGSCGLLNVRRGCGFLCSVAVRRKRAEVRELRCLYNYVTICGKHAY
jgi:hypothetical protein